MMRCRACRHALPTVPARASPQASHARHARACAQASTLDAHVRRLELEWEIASEIASEIAPRQPHAPHAPRPASVFGARLHLPAGDSPAVCALLRLLRGVAEAAERGLDLRLALPRSLHLAGRALRRAHRADHPARTAQPAPPSPHPVPLRGARRELPTPRPTTPTHAPPHHTHAPPRPTPCI